MWGVLTEEIVGVRASTLLNVLETSKLEQKDYCY